MKAKRTLHPLLQRLLALVVLGAGLGVGVSAIGMPLAEAFATKRVAEARLMRFRTAAETPAALGAAFDPNAFAAEQIDDAEAQIDLQSTLDRLAKNAGVAVQTVSPLAPEPLGDIGRTVWVEIAITCDLQAFVDFLQEMDKLRPVLLIRRLDVTRGEGPRPDVFMQVKLEAGRIWRERSP